MSSAIWVSRRYGDDKVLGASKRYDEALRKGKMALKEGETHYVRQYVESNSKSIPEILREIADKIEEEED